MWGKEAWGVSTTFAHACMDTSILVSGSAKRGDNPLSRDDHALGSGLAGGDNHRTPGVIIPEAV